MYAVKEVTEEVFDSQLEVSLKDAVALNGAYEIGDVVLKLRQKTLPHCQTAKQVILQRVREAERTIIYNEFSEYENDIMQGIVERQDRRYIYVNLGKIKQSYQNKICQMNFTNRMIGLKFTYHVLKTHQKAHKFCKP